MQKMTKKMLREYQAGWDAVHEVEEAELQAQSPPQKYQELLTLFSFWKRIGGLQNEIPEDTTVVRNRWNSLRKKLGQRHG